MLENAQQYLSLAAIAISLATTIYAFITSRSRVNAEHLKTVDGSLKSHDRRIQKMENEIEHLPDKDDVVELKLAMAKLEGTVGRLDDSLKGVDRTVRRIDDFLSVERNK